MRAVYGENPESAPGFCGATKLAKEGDPPEIRQSSVVCPASSRCISTFRCHACTIFMHTGLCCYRVRAVCAVEIWRDLPAGFDVESEGGGSVRTDSYAD